MTFGVSHGPPSRPVPSRPMSLVLTVLWLGPFPHSSHVTYRAAEMNEMTTTRGQGRAIAALMSELRPDWDYHGCLAAVGAVRHKHPLEVAMAAVRLCATAEAETPGALKAEQGQHWRERLAPRTHRQPPKRDQECRRHMGEWADACRPCRAEAVAKAEEDSAEPVEPQTTATGYANAIRGQLASFLANTCLHAVPLSRCAECQKANRATTPTTPQPTPHPTNPAAESVAGEGEQP